MQDILHVDDSNPTATIIGDLGSGGLHPLETYDCIIFSQTLQYVFDVGEALQEIRRALRPGGVALLTVPGVAPISPDEWRHSFYWRFTANSLERLLVTAFNPANVTVSPYGNLYAATAFLHSAAAEELRKKKLQPVMPDYAIVIAGRAVA
jgi:SAM-dependent methyltransferase